MSIAVASPDSQAILLLCSSLAAGSESTVKPFAPKEWHELARALRDRNASPRSLLGHDAIGLGESFGLDLATAERVAQLAARGGQLAVALEGLASIGIWPMTRADDRYPRLLKDRLRGAAPPVLFAAGDRSVLDNDALAVVGSRDVGSVGLEVAKALGRGCAREHVALVSGGAKGVDAAAMAAAVEAGGCAIGVLAESLQRAVARRDFRQPMSDGHLLLLTAIHPKAGFTVGNAMARNKVVYALSRAGVVVATSADKGGTWAGAVENLKQRWVPLHVVDDGTDGTKALIGRGGHALNSSAANNTAVRELFEARVAEPALSVARELAPLVAPASEAGSSVADLFSLVWPTVAAYLTEPRTDKDVAAHFALEPAQARAWLKRALDERLVEKRSRPVRYLCAADQPEQLFADLESKKGDTA